MNTEQNSEHNSTFSAWKLGLVLVLVAGLLVFAAANLGDFKHFLKLLSEMDPLWLLAGGVLQVLTYVATGGVWTHVAKLSGYKLGLGRASLLAVEQLAIDQMVPVGGLAGNTFIARSMTRLGMPAKLATEIILINIISFHIAYSSVTAVSVAILWFYGGITPIVLGVVSAYFLISVGITLTAVLITYNKIRKIPSWLSRLQAVSAARGILERISPEKVLSVGVLSRTSVLRILVFMLDALTLLVVMYSLGVELNPFAAFAALVIGSIAGSISFLPGGIVGFELGTIAILLAFGVATEAAVAATIILRGLTLWLPLVPGIYLSRHQVSLTE